ncbi:membrane protein [Mycobacterium Phage Rifter]|uniref:Uncharacterized protein n=2 Tax=Gladiatorvirus gladiator TaxID=1034135 RepID=A0A1C9LYX7_9CAUD|nr:site-specific recombination directionality factor RDF [Mycobacterium phage Gladiator]AEJ95055.1 hypothetical protein GLADIATOR_80 [Mycobacterium phage Gladiator]AOQ28097.1 hypothetical protein SEA_GRUUNAGA_83 [Mycobacterium phage Gruunaga]UQS94653.1 membrane protein [Mycobacterium Phage Rifter]WRQ08714.1 hypothetical protein JDBV06_00430 [Mycobacterium phage miche]
MRFLSFVVMVLSVLVMILALSRMPAAHAEVSARCLAHLAKVDQSNTPGADRRYHLERGEFSPCSSSDADEGREAVGTRGPAASPDNDNHRDKKSRYCRKHWYC